MPAITYKALLPIPLLCPQLQLAIGLPALSLEADVTGNLAVSAALSVHPPTIALYLDALIAAEAALDLAAQFSLPTVAFDVATSLDLEASLQLSLNLLLDFELGLSLAAFLEALIGLYAFSYEGPGNGLGAALTSELSSSWPDGAPTSGQCNAIILGAASPIAQQQIAAFLNGIGWGPGLVAAAKLSSMAALSVVTAKAQTQAEAAISAKLAAQVKCTAALKARASISLPIASVTAAALLKAQLNLAAQLDLAPPSVSVAVSATAAIAASIQASFGFMVSLGACLKRFDAELFCYAYSGPGNGLGAAVTTALASTWGDGLTPTSAECGAVALATTDSFSASVVASFFGGL